MAKKTRWFPCSIKPVRNGWYEVDLGGYGLPDLCLFSGGRWRKYTNIKNKAVGVCRPGYWKSDRWRGLAK